MYIDIQSLQLCDAHFRDLLCRSGLELYRIAAMLDAAAGAVVGRLRVFDCFDRTAAAPPPLGVDTEGIASPAPKVVSSVHAAAAAAAAVVDVAVETAYDMRPRSGALLPVPTSDKFSFSTLLSLYSKVSFNCFLPCFLLLRELNYRCGFHTPR